MKTIMYLLSMTIAIITMSCTSTQKATQSPKETKGAMYTPENKTLALHFNEQNFKDTVYQQKSYDLIDGKYKRLRSHMVPGYYRSEKIEHLGFVGTQEIEVFNVSNNSEQSGQIGVNIEGKNFTSRDSLGKVLSTYTYQAVFSTTTKSPAQFTGDLYQFKSTLYPNSPYIKISNYNEDGKAVPVIFYPREKEVQNLSLNLETLDIKRAIKDGVLTYNETMFFKGTYSYLKEVKTIQRMTRVGGVDLASPKEYVPIYEPKEWNVTYEKTSKYERSTFCENGFVTKIYLLPYAKDIVYINYGGKKDAKGNYIYKHVLYDEEEITLSKYLDITELKNKN